MIKYLVLTVSVAISVLSYDINDDLRLQSFGTFNSEYTPENSSDKTNTNGSLLGTQLDWDLTDSFSAMLQGIYQQDSEKNYKASLEWAMLSYQFGIGHQVRVGQFKVPFMANSDTRYIGYSRLWNRALLLPNGTNGFDEMVGVEYVENSYIEDIDLEYQLSYGKAEHDRSSEKNDYLWSAVLKATYDASWLRVSYGQLSFEHFYQDHPTLTSAKDIITFSSIESKINYDAFNLYLGYAKNQTDVIAQQTLKYIGLSYSFKKFTPYVLYTDGESTNELYEPVPTSSIPVGPPPSNGGPPPPLMTQDGYELKKVTGIGFRYDVHPNIAIKGQYNHFNIKKHLSYTGDTVEKFETYELSVSVVF